MIDFFNISRQDKSFHKKIVNDITKIINSNDFINGKAVKLFEKNLQNFIHQKLYISC